MRYEVNVNRLENPSGNIRGFVNVVFNHCFKVSNIAVVEGKEQNLFVSMPRYAISRGDEDYKDVCNPITKEFREELYDTILNAFDSLEPGEHTKVNVGMDEKKEPLDFNVKVTPFEREGSNIRGLARVYLEDSFVITHTSHTQTTPETVYFKEFSSENSHAACAKPLATDKTLCK